ncbi:WD40-repeat-containing domain protein [Cyathus striatus]|nr:WD40-repeat-containing domain protein [Cyathus striatus]
MRFTKPSWVAHKDAVKTDNNAKRLSIFSVHVHPDGSRIATGGLDAKIRIWSTKPILNPASEASGKPPKSLCTLTMHTGPVLTVRWAHSGRWLASGSDDEIVMIWDLDPNAKGKVWGTDEVNVEGWKPLKRLPGHESDVTDLAWSPGDRYLASVGLDSAVFIWCGYTLERLRKLDMHQGFVKGVCWDPVGEFLATQSDDRTVKIWRTTDWGLEAEVRKPFEDSPGSTFFRRLSWSPDGAHITAANATNNKGFVFIAAVIARNTWTSEISLVGHENTVEVAAYNPHIFLRNPNAPVQTANICSVVALGADDRSVSVWQTKSARPLIVAKEVFERHIMDLSWSWDGLTLYAASSDGTLAVFNFDPEELEGIAPHSAQEQYLAKFGFIPPPVPGGYSHFGGAGVGPGPEKMTPPPSPGRVDNFEPVANANVNGEKVNVLVAKRGKKRAQLQPGGVPSASRPSASTPVANGRPPISKRAQLIPIQDNNKPNGPLMLSPLFPPPSEQPFNDIAPQKWSDGMAMDLDVPIDALDSAFPAKGKRKASIDDEARPIPKARTLGGDRAREVGVARELAAAQWVGQSTGIAGGSGVLLPTLPVLTYLTTDVEGGEEVFDGKNSEDGRPTEVIFVLGKQTQWLDYLPSPVITLRATSSFCAAAMQDGSINVYSHTGRRLMPTVVLGSPCAIMEASKNALFIVTSSGMAYCWNIKKQTPFFPPTSIAPVLSSPNQVISSTAVRPNGSPVVTCSNGVVYTYDTSLCSWVKVTEKWWSEGSDVWQGRQRGNNTTRQGVMSNIEASIAGTPDESNADKQRPEWWSAALTLGHLEAKLHATRLLDSPQEYKQALLLYAKKIADEGFRAKGEELIKELFGPVYWRPGRDDGWSPIVAGQLLKRDLLRDVLSVFARSKTLTKLAMDWQDTLKKSLNED